MEKRTILAIALSFLILVAFDFAYKKYFPPEKPPQTVEESSTAEAPVQESNYEPRALEETRNLNVAEAPKQIFETDTTADSLQKIVIESGLYRAVLSNKGAVLYSWILNDYKSSVGEEFDMVSPGNEGEDWSQPGSLFFESENISELANEELYEVTVNNSSYTGFPVAAPATVVMTLRRGDLEIIKTYNFFNDNFTVGLTSSARKGGEELAGKFFLAQDIGPIEEYIEGRWTDLKATYFDSKKVQHESAPDEEDGTELISGNIHWVGLDSHYFTAIAIPDHTISSFEIRGYPTVTELQKSSLERDLLSVKIPFDGSLDCLLYLGPKKQSNLKAIPDYDLSGVIDYGFFSVIALPLLYALRWIQQYVHNYGTSIVILTLLLSIVLLPLRLKQMFSMKRMQAIQPKVKAVQEKYKKYKKTDPKRAEMNQEIMALYKAHKVNPMGGCLPLLVQMPLLFAFYRLLGNSIELRQAPFIFWIHDLSAKDPYYVIPILMGLSMFLSQKITPMAPTTADNPQAKLMQYMPIAMVFFFYRLSSGLNLYFLCSNIFQVGFQKLYELFIGEPKNETKFKRDKKRKK